MTTEQSKQLKKLNEKWDLHSLVQDAISKAHTEPSPETKKELALLKDNHNIIMEKLDNFIDESRTHHQEVELKIAELPKKLADEFDHRYASKLTETLVYSLVGLIVTGVVIALLGSIMIQ
jgi:hypothetical protein